MQPLAVELIPIHCGWAIVLTDGREVARFRGIGAKHRALRYLTRGNPTGLLGPRRMSGAR